MAGHVTGVGVHTPLTHCCGMEMGKCVGVGVGMCVCVLCCVVLCCVVCVRVLACV